MKALTAVTVVIHQDDFLEQVCWCVVDHTVDRAQDHRQCLVHEDEDHRDLRKVLWVRQQLTPVKINSRLLANDVKNVSQRQLNIKSGKRGKHRATGTKIHLIHLPFIGFSYLFFTFFPVFVLSTAQKQFRKYENVSM